MNLRIPSALIYRPPTLPDNSVVAKADTASTKADTGAATPVEAPAADVLRGSSPLRQSALLPADDLAFAVLARKAYPGTVTAIANPGPQDLRNARGSVQEARKGLADLQRLDVEREALSAEKKELEGQIMGLTATAQEAEVALAEARRRAAKDDGIVGWLKGLFGGGGDDTSSIERRLVETQSQLESARARLGEVHSALGENTRRTTERSEDVSKALDEARRLSGADPNTARLLDAVQDAFVRRAWPAALAGCDDAGQHLAERYRKALLESPIRARSADQIARL